MDIDYSAINETPKGFRVEKKLKGMPRLRRTFDTYDEAVKALTGYYKGDDSSTKEGRMNYELTWSILFKSTCNDRWRVRGEAQRLNAERLIRDYLGGHRRVSEFDQRAADALTDRLFIDKKSTSTVNRYQSALRTMLKVGEEKGLINWKLPRIMYHKVKATRISFYSYPIEAQIEGVMRQMGEHEMADLFTVLIDTGMRTMEGACLEKQDVHLSSGTITVWENTTKTGSARVVPLTQRALGLLKRRMDCTTGERVFPTATKSKLRSVWDNVRRALDKEGEDHKDFIWYCTRHTCATRMVQAGVDIRTVQQILGHKRIETTMRYLQFSSGMYGSAVSALDKAREAHLETRNTVA
jgi:integrase